MTNLNSSIGHATTIRQQYTMPSATMYYPSNQEGKKVQMVKNQTILVGGVYHRRHKPLPDTTTTNLLLTKGLAIDV